MNQRFIVVAATERQGICCYAVDAPDKEAAQDVIAGAVSQRVTAMEVWTEDEFTELSYELTLDRAGFVVEET